LSLEAHDRTSLPGTFSGFATQLLIRGFMWDTSYPGCLAESTLTRRLNLMAIMIGMPEQVFISLLANIAFSQDSVREICGGTHHYPSGLSIVG
jgi:hypothetical protein